MTDAQYQRWREDYAIKNDKLELLDNPKKLSKEQIVKLHALIETIDEMSDTPFEEFYDRDKFLTEVDKILKRI